MSLKEINLISEISIVRFQIDGINFGLDVYQIRDIIRLTDITRVPNSQDYILGVINLRGMIIPVINLRKRLSFDNENYTGDIRILITEYGEEWAGLMVDSVSDVINLPSTNIEPRPRYLVNNIDANFLIGLGLDITQQNNHSSFQGVKSTSESEMILLLDLGKVLNIKDHLKEKSSIKKIIERKSAMLAEEREKIKENILRLKDSTKDSLLGSIKSKVALQKVKNKDQEEMFKKKQEEIINKIKLSQKSNLSLGLSDQIQGLRRSKTGEIMPLDTSRGLSGKGKKIVRRVVVRRKSHKKPSIVNESDQISFGKIKLEEIPLNKTQELETSEESKEENPFLTMNEMQKSLIQEIGNIGAGNAATALSTMIDKRVSISVPTVHVCPVEEITSTLGGEEKPSIAIYIGVEGDVSMYMMLIFSRSSGLRLSDMLLFQERSQEELESNDPLGQMDESALQEVGNILASHYLTALSEFTNLHMIPGPPSLSYDMLGSIIDFIQIEIGETIGTALILNTDIFVEDRRIEGYILILPIPETITSMIKEMGL